MPPLSCPAVTGTRSVLLVGRADPTQVVRPADPPRAAEQVQNIAGPDALGRLYLIVEEQAISWLYTSHDPL